MVGNIIAGKRLFYYFNNYVMKKLVFIVLASGTLLAFGAGNFERTPMASAGLSPYDLANDTTPKKHKHKKDSTSRDSSRIVIAGIVQHANSKWKTIPSYKLWATLHRLTGQVEAVAWTTLRDIRSLQCFIAEKGVNGVCAEFTLRNPGSSFSLRFLCDEKGSRRVGHAAGITALRSLRCFSGEKWVCAELILLKIHILQTGQIV
jgi:hypothetical protein